MELSSAIVEEQYRTHLRNQLERGRAVLMTGAGFSLDAKTRGGNAIPNPAQLRDSLWELAFPGENVDETSSLGEVFDVALSTNRNNTIAAMRSLLTVDYNTIPLVYQQWFSLPWVAHYTINIDDLDEAVGRRFDLPRPIVAISGMQWDLPRTPGLLSVHLNGMLKDLPDVVFSPQQYAQRATGADPWYAHLAAEFSGHTVVFVGTTIDEPSLWSHIELRGNRIGHRELRPRSYLVTPTVSRARAAMLERYNVHLVRMTHQEFAAEVLRDLASTTTAGLQTIERRTPSTAQAVVMLSQLRGTGGTDPADFLLGREPEWADIESGYAIEREWDRELGDFAMDSAPGVLLLAGTAGSGKSSSLMRLALRLDAEGRKVGIMPANLAIGIGRIREQVAEAELDVLIVDDADEFGSAAGKLLNDLARDNPRMLIGAGIRSAKLETLGIIDDLTDTIYSRHDVPHLEDSDIDLLIDALDRANRLGALRGLTLNQRRQKFTSAADRQLLVAMIETTSDQRFSDKIVEECSALSGRQEFIYAAIALATGFRQFLTPQEVLLASGSASNEELNALQQLENMKLVRRTNQNQLRLRHRVIADKVVDHYVFMGLLGPVLEGLLFALATGAGPSMPRHSREQKMLVRLLNHKLMIQLSGNNVQIPRSAYGAVESLLANDPHFWLQRGRFETEAGNADLAQNFCDQARSLAPNDPYVLTAWAAITLKRAAADPTAPSSSDRADEAFEVLELAIAARGNDSPLPYHVLGSQGLSWFRRATMGTDAKKRLLEYLRAYMREGSGRHPKSRELQELRTEFDREYLMLSVPDPQTSLDIDGN